MPRTVAVVTSVRKASLEVFYAAWYDDDLMLVAPPWDGLVVVEDGHALRTDWQPYGVEVLDDERLLGWLGGLATDAVSSGDSARKSYGFAYAVERMAAEVVVALDDDCLPDPRYRRGFRAAHEDALFRTPRYASSVPDRPVRGLPYGDLPAVDVMANMGFWSGVPDDDAVAALAASRAGGPGMIDFATVASTRLMPSQQYWPFCGMNFAARAEALPGLYFPKQGKGVPYRRFDDIWCGTILQRACAHLGLGLTAGPPYINHSKASDPMVNLVKEAPGIAANQVFWKIVDAIDLGNADTLAKAVERVASAFARGEGHALAESAHPGFGHYLKRLGGWLADWLALAERVEKNRCYRPTSTRSPSSPPTAVRA